MIATREQLKIWFRKGLYPLESQFHAWIDSFWHKSEKLPLSQIEGLAEAINGKADATLIYTKQDKTDNELLTNDKTVTGAINEIKNGLDDAKTYPGRLTEIGNDGKINSILKAGENITIDEQTGLISVPLEWNIQNIDCASPVFSASSDVVFATILASYNANSMALGCMDLSETTNKCVNIVVSNNHPKGITVFIPTIGGWDNIHNLSSGLTVLSGGHAEISMLISGDKKTIVTVAKLF